MSILYLHVSIQVLLLSLFLLFFFSLSIALIFSFIYRLPKKYLISLFVLDILDIVFFYFISVSVKVTKGLTSLPHEALHHLPYYLFIIALALLLFITVFLLISMIRRSRKTLSLMAIKESVDSLPCGVLFAEKDGRIVLINNRMDELLTFCFQKKIYDGKDLLLKLMTEEKVKIVEESPNLIVSVEHKIYLFTEETNHIHGMEVIEIYAKDITLLYKLKHELEEKNKKLSAWNKELKEFSNKIDTYIREKEILSYKVKVHEEIGKLLLQTKHELSLPLDEKRKQELLTRWRYAIDHFLGEEEEKEDLFLSFQKACEAIGIEASIRGKLPEDKHSQYLFIKACIECATNASKHAKAKHINIEIENKKYSDEITITNDGIPPAQEIVLKGGLASLKTMVEQEKGFFHITSTPNFILKLTLRKGESI